MLGKMWDKEVGQWLIWRSVKCSQRLHAAEKHACTQLCKIIPDLH